MTTQATRKNSSTLEIPPQPQVVMQLMEEFKQEEPEIARIVELIRTDPSLSGRVLKLANSPAYGSVMKITSIQHAVSMLGLRSFHRLVLTGAMKIALSGGRESTRFAGTWKFMVTASKVCEFICQWKRMPVSPDEAFLAALFQECGIPLMDQRYEGYIDLYERDGINNANIVKWEERKFGSNHAEIGYLLAKSWGLPNDICLAIKHHHDPKPDDLGRMEDTSLWFLLRLSGVMLGSMIERRGSTCSVNNYVLLDGFKFSGMSKKLLGEYGFSTQDVKDLYRDMCDHLLPVLAGVADDDDPY